MRFNKGAYFFALSEIRATAPALTNGKRETKMVSLSL
jgi:hypothetical protein